ncbi:Oidioi.mRNA.OKI2018_I69.chr2.g5968.t2.cds [Oikopleura dioica]|uniref:Oidioi.mRNA.OKI2018_I69.chr2.g5968.t2.cds n=1 Tax=Oikopleura dioica TaxID=34765 RepID=A0ABN7T573_OIKDI|nr:Oidioi.mRNA.OKI2018_I69.chr2.g5968.t2.cds [Oikopleura dioica]
MTDVAVILQSLESGTLPMQSGLSALLMKSRDNPVEVLSSVPFLVQRLSNENDLNKISIILNIFCELLGASESERVGDSTAESIIKSDVLTTLFSLLPETEFSVRFPLLRTLLYTCQRVPKDVQLAAVSSGIAIGQLTGILQDSREILRNEAVLLFSELCEDNQDLPVLFAFESGFELLIHIFESESWADGGVVVQDCLQLMWLVLNENTNTQSFFKEMGFMHKLLPLFAAPERWGKRRSAIASSSVQLFSVFVSPSLPANHVIAMVQTMDQIGLLPHVLNLVRSPGCPDEVVESCLIHLSRVCSQSSTQSIIDSGVCLAALTLTLNSERRFPLRQAGWELTRACIQRSAVTQQELVFGISQATAGDTTQPKTFGSLMGRHILVALMGGDASCCWFSATILARCLTDPSVKEWLLTVKLPYQDSDGSVKRSVTLFTILTSRILQRPVRLAILLLLASWSHGSPGAIAALLSNSPETPEANSLHVLLNILSQNPNSDDLLDISERCVSSYILLLAVLQLPAVRGQLIPVLQQLGGRFVDPLRIANKKSSMYKSGDLLLEEDFRKLVRDALPAAEEIMKVQLKPKTPSPTQTPAPKASTPEPKKEEELEENRDSEMKSEHSSPSPSPIPTMDSSMTKEADTSSIIEKEELEQQILDMSNELICLRERINDLESELDTKSVDVEKYSNEVKSLQENLEGKSAESNKTAEKIKELEANLEEKSKDNISYSRKIDELEEQLILLESESNSTAATANGDAKPGDQSQSKRIKELEAELKSVTLKANHSKIAMTNLEKSISSYHDKINMLEARNVEIQTHLTGVEEHNKKLKSELIEKTTQCEKSEEEVRVLMSSTSSDNIENATKIQELEAERDLLLSENTQKFDQNRVLQDRILKLETLLKQQNEFIDKHEQEAQNNRDIQEKIVLLEDALQDMEARHKREMNYKDDALSELERQLDRKESQAKETKETISDLKEMLSETKETIHEHVAVIGSQRAEIDSLRNLLDQNGIELPARKNSSGSTERVRQSSAESSTPTVVENGDQGEPKDLDMMHLQKPVHADVLLRIDSTNSESSRTSNSKAEKPESKPSATSPSIEITANSEIINQSSQNPPKSEESDEFFDSPRSSHYEHLRRMMPSAVSSGADISANEGFDYDADVTETKRRKSKIQLDRIRQHGEKQKIREKSNEADNKSQEQDKNSSEKSSSSKSSKKPNAPSSRSKAAQKKPNKKIANKPPRSKRK